MNIFYNKFTIEICDNGRGISEEGLKKLFLDFSSLKEHQGTNLRGTGLGLSICKQLIQKMGGTVGVTSKVGEGTTFKISLTLKCRIDHWDSTISQSSAK